MICNLVSIVIPTFKRLKKLHQAIESVLNQTHSSIEILVINDDDSDDNHVLNVIDSFKDSRIKYFKNSRKKGANGARNTGILNANGEYIAFLDDDDEWLINKLEGQLKCLKTKKDTYGGVYSGYLIEKNKKWEEYIGNVEGRIINEVILDEVKVCTGSNLLIKTETIKKVGLWDEDLLRQQDLEFLIRFLNDYELAFDKNTVVKIYGHNTPNPKKAFKEREKYILKISNFLKMLPENKMNQFYSDHYRRQAIYLLKMNETRIALKYWKKAIKINLISSRKDIKILFFYFKNIYKPINNKKLL